MLFLWSVLCFTAVVGQNFDAWDRVLHRHVKAGELEGIGTNVVNYSGIATDPDFNTFVASLETAAVHNLTKNETYALFMNAYNALAIKMILDHPCKHNIFGQCKGPISSITDIGIKIFGPASSVWLKTAGTIGGKSYSLQDIENYLRSPAPFSEDSRLHACIVCASISCPNVRAEAFRASTIDGQMTAQVRDMLRNPKKGLSLNRNDQTLTLSHIYSWYAADFEKAAGTVIDFVLPYIDSDDDRAFVAEHKNSIKVQYFDYDWHVNGEAPCSCHSSLDLLAV